MTVKEIQIRLFLLLYMNSSIQVKDVDMIHDSKLSLTTKYGDLFTLTIKKEK